MSTQTLTIEVPDEVYEQLAETVEISGMTLDDLIAASCSMVFKDPTQATMKRVLKVAHAYKISRILASYPKTRRNGTENTEETQEK